MEKYMSFHHVPSQPPDLGYVLPGHRSSPLGPGCFLGGTSGLFLVSKFIGETPRFGQNWFGLWCPSETENWHVDFIMDFCVIMTARILIFCHIFFPAQTPFFCTLDFMTTSHCCWLPANRCCWFSLVLCVRCWWCMPLHWTAVYLQDFSVVGVNKELDVRQMASSSTDMSLSWSHGCGMISWGWPFAMLTGQGNEWLVAGSADLPVMVMQFFSHKHIGRSPSFHSWTLAQPWKLETIDGSGGKSMQTGNVFLCTDLRITYYDSIRSRESEGTCERLWKNKSVHYSTQQISADVKMRKTSQDLQVAVSRF